MLWSTPVGQRAGHLQKAGLLTRQQSNATRSPTENVHNFKSFRSCVGQRDSAVPPMPCFRSIAMNFPVSSMATSHLLYPLALSFENQHKSSEAAKYCPGAQDVATPTVRHSRPLTLRWSSSLPNWVAHPEGCSQKSTPPKSASSALHIRSSISSGTRGTPGWWGNCIREKDETKQHSLKHLNTCS